MKKLFQFMQERKNSIVLFIIFLVFNLYYFVNNFFLIFLNKNYNGDEYYDKNLYFISTISAEKVFSSPSQPYIFICSVVNWLINFPKISTRLVSLISGVFVLFYFLKRINKVECSLLEKTYKSTLFICALFITNQMFIGTSDFLSYIFIVPAFLLIVESIKFGEITLNTKQSILVGVLFAFAIATRPTSIILVGAFYITFLIVFGLKNLFRKVNYITAITVIFTFLMINFVPLLKQNKIILDVKEIPKETGVNWFQRNYLMAKYWDSKQIPQTQWVSTKEVIDFKKSNPNFDFPKNQIDLLVKEPGLYFRQMIRMFIKSFYSSYRFMYVLFPILFFSFVKSKRYITVSAINNKDSIKTAQNRFLVIFYLICILIFSFIAVKFLEFRWIIPIMMLYAYFSINYISNFPVQIRFFMYNFSFMSGTIMYVAFFMKSN